MDRNGILDNSGVPEQPAQVLASLSPLHRARAKHRTKSRDKAMTRLDRRSGSGPSHWRQFMELNFAPIMVTDRSGRIVAVNAAFSALTGYARGEVVGRRASLLKSDTMPECLFRDLWHCVLQGQSWLGEIQNRRKDGSLFWCQVNICPVPDARSATTRFMSVLRDLTPLKDAEARASALTERLHQAQRLEALGALAGGVAHDFNNILAIINGFTHAGLQSCVPDSALRNDLRSILTAVNRGKELTRRILSFSRRANSQLRPLDLGVTVFEGLKLVRAAIPDQIAIRQRRGNSPKFILGDETEWHQVITNLCVNSAQAIGQSAGEIEIELRSDRELECDPDFGLAVPYLELAVHDTGPGISPADLPHIFDPFYTTKGCREGTGLGLTIVHGIVAKSGGRVRAENRSAGGATIRILVPALPEGRSNA